MSRKGLQIIFHLRKGVKWHDGMEFTADDVVFTYNKVTYPKVPTPYGINYGPVQKVEAIDKYTVKVTYKEPYAPALESWGMGILPKHILEGKDITALFFIHTAFAYALASRSVRSPSSSAATSKSYCDCRPVQNWADVPKNFANLSAVSAVKNLQSSPFHPYLPTRGTNTHGV